MSNDRETSDEQDLSVYEETVGRDTPEGRKNLADSLRGLRDLAIQNSGIDTETDKPDWSLSEETKAIGRQGIADARRELHRPRTPSSRASIQEARRALREADAKRAAHEAQENDPQ